MHFDGYGRLVPEGLFAKANLSSRRYFKPNEKSQDPVQIYRNIETYLGRLPDLSLDEFEAKIAQLKHMLAQDPHLHQLERCTPIPFILPKGTVTADLQVSMTTYIASLKRSFEENQPGRHFTDHSIDEWKALFSINPKSRAARLMTLCETQSVVGLFCPALPEYSVPAAFEAIEQLPDLLTLSGFFEIAAVLIGSPDYLINTKAYSPLLWATANIGSDQSGGFHFAAYGYDMTLNYRVHLNEASEYWWSGVTISLKY